MTYTEHEKIILSVIRKIPRISHNELIKESGIPKKTFEKHLKSLIKSERVRFYKFEQKKHYWVKPTKRGKNGLLIPLSNAEKIEWRIAWKHYESQELFDVMKKSMSKLTLDKSDISFARLVFKNILCNCLSVLIHDSFLDLTKNPHQRYIKKYKKLIKEFFEFIAQKKYPNWKNNNITSKKSYTLSRKNLIKATQKFTIDGSEEELEPFALEISRLYSETNDLIFNDPTLKTIFTDNIEFSFSSLIIDYNKIKNR